MRFSLFALILYLLVPFIGFAQQKFAINQSVSVEWNGKWYKATILEVKENVYKIHYEGYASSWDETVFPSRIRPIGKVNTANPAVAKPKASVQFGKYGCTASKYSGGQYTYIPKGSFVLKKDGTYTYNGFNKPSTGKFTVDASGVISFKQGYLNGGTATPIEGYQNRYYLVFPTIPDGRWTCSLTSS